MGKSTHFFGQPVYGQLINSNDRHLNHPIQFILKGAVGFGFSTKANFPFSMYVYANIIFLIDIFQFGKI